jgi:adenylate cyclase
MLNDYFSLWQPIVEKENGIIIRFIGDAVVAIFLQETNPDYMVSAVRASSALMSELKVMNQHRQDKGLFTIQNGIVWLSLRSCLP